MNLGDLFLAVIGIVFIVIEFLWEHRGVVAVLLALMALVNIGSGVGSAAEALWQIHGLLDGERRAREKLDPGPY